MDEMEKRGYRVSTEWRDKNYRGQKAESYSNLEETNISSPIYKEHNVELSLTKQDTMNLLKAVKNIQLH